MPPAATKVDANAMALHYQRQKRAARKTSRTAAPSHRFPLALVYEKRLKVATTRTHSRPEARKSATRCLWGPSLLFGSRDLATLRSTTIHSVSPSPCARPTGLLKAVPAPWYFFKVVALALTLSFFRPRELENWRSSSIRTSVSKLHHPWAPQSSSSP
ncbi:hypothetical protein BGZ63DRAFT_399987 [Mariannaea sp. PMI_226]|nr:hypothetical protein BGZ63DRAFT_399987 [Mariannaea sp. PMI_226]